jgi:hypothetical protein
MAKIKQTAKKVNQLPKKQARMKYTYEEKGKTKVGRVVRDPITGQAEPVKPLPKETRKKVRQQAIKFEKKQQEKQEGSEYK